MEADERLREKYPLLANPPNHSHRHIDTPPYRLYNGIAPLSDDSILFINYTMGGTKMLTAEAQAIWVIACFEKRLVLSSMEEREKEIVDQVAQCGLRYLSNGERGDLAAFDSVPYVEKVLMDIRLMAHHMS